MIYIVKFIYTMFILPPGILVTGLLFLLWRSYKKDRRINKGIAIFTCFLYLITIPFICNNVMRALEGSINPPETVSGDVIIMLGGGATPDSPNISTKGNLGGNSANRLLTCMQLSRKLDVPIIISGGKVFDSSGDEAVIARSILINLGVPENKIIIDDKSLNTTQNAQFTREIINRYGFKDPILVTSAFHMRRSVIQFKKVGIDVTPYPCGYLVSRKFSVDLFDFVPSTESFNYLTYALKEYIGIAFSKWY